MMMMTPEDFKTVTVIGLVTMGAIYAHPFTIMVFDFLNQRGAFH